MDPWLFVVGTETGTLDRTSLRRAAGADDRLMGLMVESCWLRQCHPRLSAAAWGFNGETHRQLKNPSKLFLDEIISLPIGCESAGSVSKNGDL